MISVVKIRLSESRKQKQKDKRITLHIPKLCDWFSSSASVCDSSLDPVKRSRKRHQKVVRSLNRKFQASDYDSDSDSVASKNQPSRINEKKTEEDK